MGDRNRVTRPALLTVGMILSAGTGAMLLMCVPLMLSGFGHYEIEGETVSAAEFAAVGLVPFAVGGAMLFAIGLTLAMNHPASRELMIGWWLLCAAAAIAYALKNNGAILDLTWLPALPVAVWYLYFKKNVREYYRQRREATGW
ncbi:MAG TPA: hypothetical protein VF824_02615 [Thermoanaerobaculia bacterium]|jgi:hypothetical protein